MRAGRLARWLIPWLAMATGARAEPLARPRVALLDAAAGSRMIAETKQRFFGTLAEMLDGLGYEVLGVMESQNQLRLAGALSGCTVGPCLSEVGRTLGVGRVVVGSIAVTGSTYDITLSLLETETGALVSQSVEQCPICTLEEGIRATRRAASRLRPARPNPAAAPRLPEPLGAPLLPPLAAQSSSDRPWYRSSTVRWLSMGLAVAAVGAGIALLAIDGQCTTPPAGPGARCAQVRDTAPAGYGLLAGGAALGLGTLVWLF